ncbi:cytochrome b-c1 complex subunit 2, mitochondrial-like [Ciona intestinalis]
MLRGSILKPRIINSAKSFLSTQAPAAQDSGSLKLSQLNNGLKVVTANQGAYGARIALLVKSGSRNDESPGLTHCLQATAGLTNNTNTAFLTTQLLSSLGAELEVIAGRDSILYQVGCHPNVAKDILVDVLAPVVFGGKYQWWEVKDVAARMKYQKALAESDPCFVLMETAHKASFAGKFGSPILCPDYLLGSHTTEMLTSRLNSEFTAGNMVLAGTGISQDALIDAAMSLENLSSGSVEKTSVPSFVSSEAHVVTPGELVHGAISFPGMALNDENCIALSVLQHALGSTSSIKRSSGLKHGVLNSAVDRATNAIFNTSAFSINYSDCGLFGVHVVAQKSDFSKVAQATAAECSKIALSGIPNDAVEGAKQRLKAKIIMGSENSAYTVEDVAVQTAVLGTVAEPSKICKMIDGISAQQVAGVAKQVLGGKKSFATVGDCLNTPRLQDIL